MAWYDDLNTGNQTASYKPGSVQELRAAMAQYKQQQTPETPKSKSWLSDQISTGGGIAGSLAGAAAGTAFLPGIGTILGGIIGGALGSGGGQVAENAITGEKDLMKDVGSEALIGGITGVPILKSGKALISGGKALLGGAGKTAANIAIKESLSKPLIGSVTKGLTKSLGTAGQTAIGEAWGIRPGVKTAGKLITPQKAKSLQSFVTDNIGVSATDNATKVLEKAVNYQDKIGSSIGSAIESIPVNKVNISQVGKNISTKFNSLIGVDAANNQVAKDIISQVSQAKTPKDLWTVRKSIDDALINFGRNPASAVPGAEQLAKAARNEINSALTSASPVIKSLNSQYSKVMDVIDLTGSAARSPKGMTLPIVGKVIPGNTAQSIRSTTGALLGKTAETASKIGSNNIPGMIGNITGATTRQLGGRMLTDQNITPVESTNNVITGASNINYPTSASTTSSPYTREALIYDMQRDPNNASKYVDYYTQLKTIYSDGSSDKYSSATAGNISDFQSSLSELNNLSNAITSGSGTLDPVLGTIRSMNPYDVDQKTLQAMIDKTRQIVGKALEGGVLRKEDEEKYKKILPTVGDTKQVALNKIAMIQAQLNSKLQNYSSLVSGGTSTGNSLEDALLQSQSQTNYNNTGY